MHACHATLLVRPSVTVSAWQLWLLPRQTPSSRTLQRSALQGRAKKTKADGGRGPCLVGTSENIPHRRTHSAVYGCFVLHVCTVAARVLPAARVHHEKHTRQVLHSACTCALCRHATSDKHTCWPRTACSCRSVCGVSYCFVMYAL